MFKIALDAGHGKNTIGKRCLKKIDKNETREWVLNARICEKIKKLLDGYEGVEVRRVDDTTGKTDVSLSKRTAAANSFGADLYLSIHHNAGIKGGTGGGLEVYIHPNAGNETEAWQKALYKALIAAGLPKGNRSKPMNTSNLQVLRETRMPAVLIECAFMDSKTDTPQILTEAFADKAAKGCVQAIAEKAGLKKKATTSGKVYRVQVGAFSTKAKAQDQVKKLKADGYDAIIV